MNYRNFLGKKLRVALTLILFTCLMCGCPRVPSEYRAFLKLSPEQRQAVMRKLPLEKQLEYYFAGLNYMHPADVGLADPIAEQGRKAVPFLLNRLSEEKDEDKKADIILILEVMHISHYNLKREEEVITLLKEVTSSAKSQRLKKEGEDALRLILEDKAPDPAKLLDKIEEGSN